MGDTEPSDSNFEYLPGDDASDDNDYSGESDCEYEYESEDDFMDEIDPVMDHGEASCLICSVTCGQTRSPCLVLMTLTLPTCLPCLCLLYVPM
ncbi:hypothetical protein E2C01_003770 [Portunus trituberculatus]|uniref:Uncharacterized protein n=1 Tax=Portunus trituberculatus TaxID=210409 RepID=A0A5B7CS43_PORTR|nr:hypothetical protein [Portunus trituberculatus]